MTRANFASNYLKARNVGCTPEAALRFACVRSSSSLLRGFGGRR